MGSSGVEGLRISPYGLLDSEITDISGRVSIQFIWSALHEHAGPYLLQAEDIMSCGFSDAVNISVVFVITHENITITKVIIDCDIYI